MASFLIGFVALVAVPFVGVYLARLAGPLTWARGLIGAVLLPIVLSLVVVLLVASTQSGNWQYYYPRVEISVTESRPGGWWAALGLWVADALIVGGESSRHGAQSTDAAISNARAAAEMSSDEPTQNRVTRYDAWKEYERVAMHFNDLLIRLRTQSIGGVAAFAAIAGIVVHTEVPERLRWAFMARSRC